MNLHSRKKTLTDGEEKQLVLDELDADEADLHGPRWHYRSLRLKGAAIPRCVAVQYRLKSA
jgi:hypothetical protein